MTYKFVGALKGITNPQPHVMKALRLGIVLGLLIDIARKLHQTQPPLPAVREDHAGRGALAISCSMPSCCPAPTPRRSAGLWNCPRALVDSGRGRGVAVRPGPSPAGRAPPAGRNGDLPADMSTMSLVGGGLIAGDSLAALSVGVYGLLKTVL